MNLWFLWEISVNFIEIFLIYYLYSKQLGIAENRKWAAWLGIIVLVSLVSILNYINIQMTWTSPNGIELYFPRIVITVADIIYSVLVFSGSFSKKLFFGLIPTGISLIADGVTQLIASLVARVDLNAATQLGTERFPLTITYLLVATLCYFIIANLPQRNRDKNIHLPVSLRMILFAILLLGMFGIDQLIDISYIAADSGNEILSNQIIFVHIAFFVILIIIFILVEYIGRITQKNLEYALEAQQTALEKNYYSNLEVTIEAIRDVRHDMKHNVQVMQGLLQQQKYEELAQYLNSIVKAHKNEFDIVLTPNATINALLSSKIYVAKSEHIQFNYTIQDSEYFSEHYFELCTILGNLIDNAIEGCKRVSDFSDRYISLTIENKNCMLYINIENTYDGIYKKEGNHYITRKTELGHGRGIRSVERIVQKYHGHISFDIQHYKFSVSILLPFE